MPQINLIFILCSLCTCWALFRYLNSYTHLERIIIIGLTGVLFFRPLIGEGFFLYPAIIFQSIIFLCAFGLLMSKFKNSQTKIVFNTIDKLFLLFLFIQIISLSRSINLLVSINQIIYFLSIYLIYWSIKNLPNDDTIKRLLIKTFIFSGFLLLIYALHQYTIGFAQMRQFLADNPEHIIKSGEFTRRVKQNLIFATFIYPPAFADYLSMLFLSIFGIACQCRQKTASMKTNLITKYFPLIMLLLIIPILIMTKSKGAWVSFFAGLSIFILMQGHQPKNSLKAFYAAGLFVLIFTGIVLFSKTILPGFESFIISGQIRLEYWKSALAIIKQHPLLGFGPGTFGIIYPVFKTKLAEETIMAHNSFLQLWAESGFLALGCFASFVYLIWIRAFKDRRKLMFLELGLLAAFFSFICQNLFDFGLFDAQRATIAFSLIGIYSLKASDENACIIIKSKKIKKKISLISGVLLLLVLFYTANIYLARHFDSKSGAALKTGHLDHASEFSEQAIRHNPLSAEYFYHRGYIFEHIARLTPKTREQASDLAVSNYQKALELNPYAAYYHLRLAKLLFLKKQVGYEQSTLLHLKKAVEMYPLNPVYHEQLAEFYDIMGDMNLKEFETKQAQELKKYFKKGTRH